MLHSEYLAATQQLLGGSSSDRFDLDRAVWGGAAGGRGGMAL